jgi:glutathione S-transferase
MSLTLYYHPLSSFCWKALIALYENGTPFTPQLVDLSNETERAALLKIWPIGKFPVLRDSAKDRVVPESSIIIEYLDTHYPGATRFLPADADARDPYGVEEAKARLRSCYGMIDKELASRTFAMGETFGLADCAAAPALFYGNMAVPFGAGHNNVAAYLERVKARPSFARVLKEAEPYFSMVPKET